MKSSRRTEVSHKSSAQHLTSHNTVAELTNAWKNLSQSKAALRHIENRLEATSGTAVLLDSVMDTCKKKTIRTVSNGDGQQANGNGRCSNRRGRSQQNLEKSSSRSPLRNATQDNNVRKNISVEFKEPLASYREATPPPNPSPQLEAFNLKSVPGSSCPSSSPLSDPLLSQLVHHRDTRNKQKDGDLDSIYSSARESTEVHYLNDQPVLVTQRAFGHHTQHKNVIVRGREDAEEENTPKAQPGMDRHDLSPFVVPAVGSIRRGESTPSTSPGSTSQRLENLKRHQHDDKLEKLKERIRRQRQHLEEAAEREKQLDFLEQPILAAQMNNNDGTSNMPKAKIRKVAAAPPAPIYKGFNCSETKIQTPDGKVWKEEEFHKLSRDIYRDLSQQIAESVKSRHQRQKEQRADQSRERRPPKPVRKVHRVDISPDRNTKPVISPASWREGQKLVKMVLGPDLKLPMEDRPQPSTGLNRTASLHRSCSHSRSESKQKSRPRSTERPHGGFRGQSKSHSKTTSTPSSEGRNEAPVGVTTNLLSADIQGILDDLQLECKALEKEESTCQRSRSGSNGRRGRRESGSRRKTPLSAWGTTLAIGGPTRGCRSASPTIYRPATANTTDTGLKKRHYDADAVRQYISRQQEERKRLEAEEKRALKEETEKRNQRLQELYRKQRKIAKPVDLPSEAILAPVQKRLQETYNKLLLEGAQLDQEATQAQPAPPLQMRPIYQPSGESDKENKRVAPQSPSSSDGSMNDQQPPPLSRNDLQIGCSPLVLPGFPSPAVQPMTVSNSSLPAPFGDHLLSQILRFENAIPASEVLQWPPTTASKNMRLKKSRIESLKATATSLSKSIESEARKLAGEGINYGTATTMDVDTILDPIPSQVKLDERCWAEMAATENNGKALKIQRILTSTGLSSFNGSSLPGVESLHAHTGQFEKNGTRTNSTGAQTAAVVAGSILNSYKQERGKSEYHPTNHLEKVERMDNIALGMGNSLIENKNWMDRHDSSSGSISEGPLLSEGSFSEDEASLPHPTSNHSLRPADRLKVVDYCASQRRDHQRLSEFQREAARCLALSSPLGQHDVSKTAWEELNKGSPLSVINIFTKNLHGHVRVSDRNPPSAQSSHSANDPLDAAAYEDDFVSTHSSRTSDQFERMSNSHSVNSHFVELMRRSPYEKSGGGTNSHHSSIKSPHRSSGSPSGSSPFSSYSARKRGTASDQSDATLVEEQRSSCSPSSEPLSSDSRKRGSDKSSVHRQTNSLQSSDALRGASHKSLELDRKKFKATRPIQAPPSGSPPESDPSSECARGGSLGFQQNTSTTVHSGRAETKTTGELHYSPAVLQQRMAAELHYLESIEESVRQLGDVERMRDVSMAQQESVSLAQMLKTKQQRHERDLHQLKMKAEREALETQQQLEENRQQLARAHIQLQESLTGTQIETLEGLQDAATHMLSQQAEASRYTADAARHIKEMTELARSHIEGAFVVPPAADESSILKLGQNQSFSLPQRQDKVDSDSFQSEMSHRGMSLKEPLSSLNSTSHSESLSSRRPNHSGAGSSSPRSTSQASSGHREQMKKESIEGRFMKGGAEERTEREECSSSIEDEVRTAANESIIIPSIRNDRGDSTSVATEYSVKFDESMTEDEIEERSFRSLLPSEAHRRGSKEKKSRHHEESEDDEAIHDTTLVSGPPSILKDANIAFSGGQDSFSQFTMDMVRQYMKDEDVRLQHQSSLLHLRQKAVKEKTRTELAWLDHQKKSLRDKGEDDKMPPIRKKQRGLLMKLQQEQAEIKRLQEANKAARKERQLLLKQQEEIERMRNSTFRLKERLKFAGAEPQPESSVSETIVSEAVSTNLQDAEDFRSPSPSLSISGSETSSIMQKLKKMRSHMDEKHCSPEHYFSLFTAHHWATLSVCLPNLHPKFQLFIYNQLVRFLTKREQQLMQRRHHAVELLQWKQRLDEEEAEVRKMEKDVLVVWDRQMPQDKEMSCRQKTDTSDMSHSSHRRSEPRTESEKEYVSEGNSISATSESSIHTEGLESKQPGSPSPVQATSIPEKSMASIQSSPANYTQDFTSPSQSLSIQSPLKGNHSPATSAFNASIITEMRLCSSPRSINQPHTQPTNSPMALHTEPISDQSDIESRIKALKEEVRKRKFMAYLLKKEQKKRHKERLKAQEASLLKQLQSYDNFIERTKAELNEKPDGIAQINDSSSLTEQSGVKSLAHRSEPNIISGSDRMEIDASFDDDDTLTQLDHSRSTSVPEELSEDQATITPHPNNGTPACPTSVLQSHLSTESFLRPSFLSKEAQTEMIGSGEKIMESCKTSRFQEDLEEEGSFKSEDQHSECLLRLEKEDKVDTHEKLSTHEHVSFTKCEEYCYSPCVDQDSGKQTKNIDNSEAEEAVKYGIHSSSSFAMDLKTSSHPSCRPTSSDTSCSPCSAALAPKNKALIKGVEASAGADGYRDEFESSVSPSPSDDHSSRSAFHISASHTEINGSEKNSPSKALLHYSQDGEVEEEISDELSHHSGISGASHQSGSLLDLHNQTEDSKYVTLSHSPPISPLRPPHSPVIDEMSRFYIGDRVLVGGVQPGTLRFKGPTSFAKGFWAGVELDKCEGSNNGTYDDVVYFECDESHGIFAPPDKVTHLPDKFKMYSGTTENEDLSSDDYQNKGDNKHEAGDEKSPGEGNLNTNKEHTILEFSGWGDKLTDESGYKAAYQINSRHYRESEHPISNGNTKDIIHDFNDPPTTLFVPDITEIGKWKQSQKAITNFNETDEIDPQPQFTPEDLPTGDRYEGEQKERVLLDKFVDKLLNNFVNDTVKQFEEIKKAKEQKIETANQMNGDLFCENHDQQWFSSVEQRDGLPFFLPAEKEELSSPELCNRPESPVLGASGQEKLAKRLAELELSRELLDDLGDDQDWFDEDFGLSSRREQQRLQQTQKREEARVGEAGGLGKSVSSDGATLGGLISSLGGEQQVKTPPRPELPLPLPPKLPEQPAMVVPHSAKEVEKMVHAATQEIWESCGLGKEGALIVAHLTKHKPSQEYLGKEASSNDQEALCVRSYRKAVFDLTWEIIQEIFAEDPNTDQPQWLKPRHVKSSFHRMKTPGDIAKVQEFITAEVLKLYGLKKDQTQKTDWQKMLKFGRKKRDKVDHILVQELHEEEAQWVNYDEDELFVKMQLADSIFDALLKDTANVLTVMYDNRTKTNTLS